MKEKERWAFILDRDEFVRLSLNKILKKYGFHVEEIEDFSQLEKRKRDMEDGMILADVDIEVLERWFPLLKRWTDRFMLISPLVTDELRTRLKNIGIRRIIKKPVEPRLLRRVIREIFPLDEVRTSSSGKPRTFS
ncbi:MAG: hypothetical protein ABSB22_00900 [Thermodesulfobacteriota bacterium]|jgi:DNA-binding response OmpR family regulator